MNAGRKPNDPEGTDAAVTSDTPLRQLLRAVIRFWWVALVGIVLAALAFTFATYKVTYAMPPSFESRASSTYTASTQLLVTSKGEPYLSSTNVNSKIVPLLDSSTTGTNGTATGTQTQTSTYDSGGGPDGDLARLVEISNSLPPRVTSDTVIRLRNARFGRIDGSVTAVNPYSFSGAGGFRSSPLPFIKITGTAHTPEDAIQITNQTAKAFIDWFKSRQAAAKIKKDNRVLVEQVNSAENAFAQGGSKPLLGVAAAVLVLLGGAGLVLALDRLIPRRTARRVQREAVAAPKERALPQERPAEKERAKRKEIPARDVPAEPPAPAEAPVTAEAPMTAEAPEAPADVPAEVLDEIPAEQPVELPVFEVPAFGAQVEEAPREKKAPLGTKNKPTSRQRKGTTNGTAAPRRRRTTTSTPQVAPTTDDAS
jgi:hypothetical protein